MTKTKNPYIIPYSVGIAIPIAVGLLSAFLTMGNMDIYQKVVTPPLSPPGFLFPIVWSALYILMGISSATVYLKKERDPLSAAMGLKFYAFSLLFNFGWSIIFFNLGAFSVAFVWLLVLLYLIIRTVICYHKVEPVSAYLQIPYIIWVAFAGYLNLGIVFLN